MRIPYGNADFADIRTRGLFYVDKTPFLAQLENISKTVIFLRPRRFGKSLFISLLHSYYDLGRAAQFDELFRGLWVDEHPTPEKSKYLVLRLDFSAVAVDGGEAALKASFAQTLKTSLHTFVLRNRARHPELERVLEDAKSEMEPASIMKALFGFIAGTSDHLYVLIDEYDSFANALLSDDQKDLYHRITDKVGFVRAFYRALKDGTQTGAIGRIFITGVTPLLLDDLMSGFNIVTNISNRSRFNCLVGFTRADVQRAVDELLQRRPELARLKTLSDRNRLLDTLERYYDGYRFSVDAKERVFNSTLMLYFLRELEDLGDFPRSMLDVNARTDYRRLHSLWAATGPDAEERRIVLERILSDGRVWSDLVEQFGTRRTSTRSEFISLMYYSGMLTLSPEVPDLEEYLFEVPNRVIRDLSFEHYTSLIQDLDGVNVTDRPLGQALRVMAREGGVEPFLDEFRQRVLDVVSIKDLRRYNEKSMKMLLMGAIVVSEVFHVLSEREFAHGFNDLFLSPSPRLPNAKYAWMIELKYLPTGADDAKVGQAFEQGDEQLRKYAADPQLVPMLTRGLELKTGTIVFVGCQQMHWREMVRG